MLLQILLTFLLAFAVTPSNGGDVYDTKAPQPYAFGYQIDDGQGNSQMRHEVSDEFGNKRGSYGYTDAWGVYRIVDYIADKAGYRAFIRTNEPGTSNQSPAAVKVQAEPSPAVLKAASAFPALSKTVVEPAPLVAYKSSATPVAYPAYSKAVVEPANADPHAYYSSEIGEPAFDGYESKSNAFVYKPKIVRKRIVRIKKIGKTRYTPSFGRKSYAPLAFGTKIVKPVVAVEQGDLDIPLYKDK